VSIGNYPCAFGTFRILPYLQGGQALAPAQRWGRISSAQCTSANVTIKLQVTTVKPWTAVKLTWCKSQEFISEWAQVMNLLVYCRLLVGSYPPDCKNLLGHPFGAEAALPHRGGRSRWHIALYFCVLHHLIFTVDISHCVLTLSGLGVGAEVSSSSLWHDRRWCPGQLSAQSGLDEIRMQLPLSVCVHVCLCTVVVERWT